LPSTWPAVGRGPIHRTFLSRTVGRGPCFMRYAPWAVGRVPWFVVRVALAVYVFCMSFFNVPLSTALYTAAHPLGRKCKTARRGPCRVLSTTRCANIKQRLGARGYRVKYRRSSGRGPRIVGRDRRRGGTGVKSMFLTNISQIETFLCDKSYKRDPGTPIFSRKKILFK
jgi:hypothetical protein